MTASITRAAPAKINLYLHVTAKRDDGFHELDSLAVFTELGDRITVEPGEGLTLSLTGPFAADLSADEDNLVLKSARLLADHADVQADAHITLEKNLPIASGIGGGSADAAATLKALVQFWRLELDDDDIHHVAHQVADDIDTARALSTLFKLWRDDLGTDMMHMLGLRLGADVPVCLESRAVFMGGIGEKLELAPDLPPTWLVLANPGVAVSTPEVFKARSGDFSAPARFHGHPNTPAELAELLGQRRNDLMDAAIGLSPEIQTVLDALSDLDGALFTRMSGSGATCFALFGDETSARTGAKTLQSARPDWWVQATRLLDLPLDF